MRYRILLILLAAGLFLFTLQAPSSLTQTIENENFNGSLHLSLHTNIILSQGFGFANRENRTKNTPDTQFLIASITKVFTAAAILKLVDQGKLVESAFVSAYFKPDDPIWLGQMPAWADQVTLHHLLTHSSGIVDYTALPGYGEFYKQPHTTEELIQFFAHNSLKFTPGTQFEYSGAGYNLLGAIIEKVSGKIYGDYLAEQFFQPLGMNSTFAPHTELLSQIREHHPLIAQGYVNEKGDLVPTGDINMSVDFAEASIISTVEDLYLWTKALFGGKCLSSSSLHKMLTPYFEVNKDFWIGYGIFIDLKTPAEPIYSHNGGIDGFESVLRYQPKKEISMILLSNEMGGQTYQLADLLFQEISKD